jgi:hypothetical protein
MAQVERRRSDAPTVGETSRSRFDRRDMSKSGPEVNDSLDALIREQVRSGARGKVPNGQRCESFDPNLAAAYAEELLPPTVRRDFEIHLAGCHACRSEYADFALIYRVDATPTIQTDATPTLLARIRDFFASRTPTWSPQLAMGIPALAVVLLGGLAWWVVASRPSSEPSVATGSIPAPPPPVEAPRTPSNDGPQGGDVNAQQTPSPSTNTISPGPTRKAPGPIQPVRPPKARPERPDDTVTRSVDTGQPGEASSRIRRAGGKTFVLVGGAWTDRDYLARDRSKTYTTTTIERGSAGFDSAVKTAPVLVEYAKLDGKVVVVEGDTVYTILGSGPK